MTPKQLSLLAGCSLFGSCWFSGTKMPMPRNNPEFPAPVAKPLQFTQPKKFKWNIVPADSIQPATVYPFDFAKLPSRPFNPEGFKALPKPPVVTPFNYRALPDTILNLNALKSQPLIGKTMMLGRIRKSVLTTPRLRAETYHSFFQFGEDQGLPSQMGGPTLYTRDGLIWLSTFGGLCILNGESVEILPYNYGEIFCLTEDPFNQVWIGTRREGVFVINRKTGVQKHFPGFKNVINIRLDKKGFIWMASYSEGITVISQDQKTFKSISSNNGLSSPSCATTLQDRDGRIWIGHASTKGIEIIDPAENKIKRLSTEPGLLKAVITSLFETPNGDIYAAGEDRGLDIFNIQKETHVYLEVPDFQKTFVAKILSDQNGRHWFAAADSGIVVLSRNTDSVLRIKDGGPVWGIDKVGHNMISGSYSGGLNIMPTGESIGHHISVNEGLLDEDNWGLIEDSAHRIWIGNYSGTNIITPDQKILTLKIPDSKFQRSETIQQIAPGKFALAGAKSGLVLIDEFRHTLEKIGTKQGLPSMDIRNIYIDSQGLIWICTSEYYLIVFDPVTRTVRYLNQASGLINNNITGISEMGNGKFLVSTYGGGIQLINLIDNTLSNYSVKEGLSNDQAIFVFKDRKSRYWIPTERGLDLLDFAKKTNTLFTVNQGMPSYGIYSITERDGQYYAGTEKGLTLLKESDSTATGPGENVWDLQTFGKSLGLPVVNFNGNNAVLITHTGEFWWGIKPGIGMVHESRLKPDTSLKSPQVTGIDILGKSQYFTDPGSIQNIDTLWSENKDSIYLASSFQNLNTDRQIGIEWDSLSNLFQPVNLSLPPDLNYLRFHFSKTLTAQEDEFKYQYILDGVDEKWSTVTSLPYSENYNNLSPGNYSFRVSVRRGNGNWSEPSEFTFRIRPPWWKSWWAELTYVLLTIGGIWQWVKFRSRQLTKENVRLEQKVAERTIALSNSLENLRQTQGQLIQAEKMASLGELTAGIAHEIQNPLNFVNNFSEVNTELIEEVNKALDQGDIPEVKDILRDIEMNMGKITFHGKRADAIVKGMLLHSRASSGQKIPTDVNALADEYLRLSYHGLRARDKSFNAQFTMDFDQNTGQVLLVQQDIGRVLLNLFNNAFYSVTEKKKQLPEGYQPTVSVSTKRKKESIEIRIRDNGQGIPKKVIDKIYQPFFTTKPAGHGTGLGLSLSYDIITKEHGGKIDVITQENEYTEFIIELPVQTAA